MGWVKYEKGSFPEKEGQYYVVRLIEGTPAKAFWAATAPKKRIELMTYKRLMKVEQDCVDRCVYVKYNAFVDCAAYQMKTEEILYWYKLDEMPEV